MKKSFSNNQYGIVSFFTVIFVSILLLVMTTAFIRLMLNEQRQAVDNDLSTRALYAAETGVDDAVVLIKQVLEGGDQLNSTSLGKAVNDCGQEVQLNSGQASGADISYTCQFIGLETNLLEGELEAGDVLSLDLLGVDDLRRLRVSWHIPSFDKVPDFNSVGGVSVGDNSLSIQEWQNANLPAIIRFQAIRYEESSSNPLSRSNIDNSITFAYPKDGGSSSGATIDIADSKGPSSGQNSCQGTVTSQSDYLCQVIFEGLGSKDNKFLRIQALNNSTNYSIEALDGATLPDQFAVVDVTGKAGVDVFRRVRVLVPIIPDTSLVPNQALLVDENICKDFEVSNTQGVIPDSINPICTDPSTGNF